MPQLSLVKSLSHLREEQKFTEEILLDGFGLEVTRGTVLEIAGGPSSGKKSLAMALLAKLTAVGEICAVVDAAGGFDPVSAALAGIDLANLVWVRCGGDVEKSFTSADYLVQAKGFGCIWLDVSALSADKLRMVPKTYWFRYRTRVKDTPTILLVTAAEHVVGSASQGAFIFEREKTTWSGNGRFRLLREFQLKMHARKFFVEEHRTHIEMDYSEI